MIPRWWLRLWARRVPPIQRDRWAEECEAELTVLEHRVATRSASFRLWSTTRFAWGALAQAAELNRLHSRKSNRTRMMTTMMRDSRFAIRSFGRTPGFTVVAVATLALGIGASTTMFRAMWSEDVDIWFPTSQTGSNMTTRNDPLTYLAGVVVLGLVALAACWIPARRAGRADPVRALRME